MKNKSSLRLMRLLQSGVSWFATVPNFLEDHMQCCFFYQHCGALLHMLAGFVAYSTIFLQCMFTLLSEPWLSGLLIVHWCFISAVVPRWGMGSTCHLASSSGPVQQQTGIACYRWAGSMRRRLQNWRQSASSSLPSISRQRKSWPPSVLVLRPKPLQPEELQHARVARRRQ